MKLMTRAMTAGLILAIGAGAAFAKGGPEREPLTRDAAIERAIERFEAADADGDGVISREEAKELRGKGDRKGGFGKGEGKHKGKGGKGGKRGGDHREAMLERFDADGDGELSEEERAAAREAFEARKERTQ